MKVSTSVAFVALAASMASAAPLTDSQYQGLFTRFVKIYNKEYETTNFFNKFNTFKANLDMILAHNAKESTYTLGMNQFGDLTTEEFSKFLNLDDMPTGLSSSRGVDHPAVFEDNTRLGDLSANDFHWNKHLPPVQNQASCGSCWAFSATGGLEGLVSIKTGKKLKLSEQQLVDCDTKSQACQGGLMSWSYDYLKTVGGQCGLSNYPYVARKETCRDKSCIPLANVSGYSKPIATDAVLFAALKQQPIPITLAASASAFQFYKTGVVTGSDCGTNVNHAVIAVGYGDQNGIPYYLIRNSWGPTWGDAGHIKLARGQGTAHAPKDGVCGLFYRSEWNVYPRL